MKMSVNDEKVGLPIVTVFGATGSQGGSVARQLVKAGKFRVRGVTRNPSSDAAERLRKIGVEVVNGNANDINSLQAAYQDAWSAFLVTNFWDTEAKSARDTDWVQGKNMVDAAIASGTVKFIVWSTQADVESISDGKIDVPFFSVKSRVDQYIRSKNIPAAFVHAGFYMDNWVDFEPMAAPRRQKDGRVVLQMPLRADVALPLIDIDSDFGQFVVPLYEQPERYNGKAILAATEYLTVPQMVDAYKRVTGETIHVIPVDINSVPIDAVREMMIFFNRYGTFNGQMLEPTHALYDSNRLNLHTFEGWLRSSKFRAPTS